MEQIKIHYKVWIKEIMMIFHFRIHKETTVLKRIRKYQQDNKNQFYNQRI